MTMKLILTIMAAIGLLGLAGCAGFYAGGDLGAGQAEHRNLTGR